jgi:Na+/proline symporter
MRVAGKILEALGIASVMIGLVQGIYGDMWGELYLFLGGIAIFVIGRLIEKRIDKRMKEKQDLINHTNITS